jgi:peptide deformylase
LAHAHDHTHEHEHEDEHAHDDEGLAEKRAAREREELRRFALAQIRQYPDFALRMQAHDVTEFDEHLNALVERMIHLMADAQGVGLAATQLGLLQRVFVFEVDDEPARAIVNPRLVESSGQTETDEEGCLSLEGVRVPVDRALKVTLEGVDPEGREMHLELEGLGARVVQHELDHLDGVLIIDRTDDEYRKKAMGILRPQAVLR